MKKKIQEEINSLVKKYSNRDNHKVLTLELQLLALISEREGFREAGEIFKK